MLICYLDEAGNTGRRLDDPDQPIHFIAAVMVREDRLRMMSQRLDDLAARAPTYWSLREYHGYDLFHGEGDWEGSYPDRRIRAYSQALSVLAEVDAGVAYAAINKPELAAKNHHNPNPHVYALQFLAEKIERWVRGLSNPLSQRVLLVADHNHEQEQFSVDLIRGMQAFDGPVGKGLGIGVTLDHFVDSVYFDRSERNRGIQLADLVAYITHRYYKVQYQPGNKRSDQAVQDLYRRHVMPRLKTWREPWPGGIRV